MYFNVYTDARDVVEGYLIPDGFSTKPSIMVKCGDNVFGPLGCDVFLDGPLKHGHHDTGIVGFRLSEENVPGVTDATILEISDADSRFVFYRRLAPEHITKRVFRLETQFAPHRELDNSFKSHFQFYASSAEQYGGETVRQMLEIINQPSSYVSGRVLLRSVHRYFTEDTIKITSLRDPFYEMAIRLVSVASYKKRPMSFVSERDAILFEPAMGYFADTSFDNPEKLRSKVLSAPKDVLSLFESPFTHQLVASSPTDKISREGVSSALDALSQFTIFDSSELDSGIAQSIGEFIGLDSAEISFSPVRSPFLELSEVLRDIKVLEHVLENDLILFHFIRKAEQRASAPFLQ